VTSVNGARRVALTADEIRGLLPHRWPFLYLDRIVDVDPGVAGTALKNVSVSEPQFAGHFPEQSIMPGVLVVEAMAQLAGVVIALGSDRSGPSARSYLASITRARFRKPVVPGDQLRLRATAQRVHGGLAEFRCEATVDGQVTVDATLTIAF
jgi:3-hydroxyacyl-[acyl-carrier-protein] dehydratase